MYGCSVEFVGVGVVDHYFQRSVNKMYVEKLMEQTIYIYFV